MRIHVEEDIMTDFSYTTFDIHLYDMTPEEYAEIRKVVNEALRHLAANTL